MSYPYSTEEDPLLPKSRGAPEIQGSRPQSINNEYVSDAEGLEKESQPRRYGAGDLVPIFFAICFLTSISLILFPSFGDLFDPFRPAPKTLEERVNRILTETPLIDGHNDLAIMIRFIYNNHIYDDNFKKPFEEGGMYGHVDLPRLKEGKNGGAFWSAFVPCPKNGSDFSDGNYAGSVDFTLTQIDLLTRLIAAYPTHFSPSPNSSTAISAFKSGQLISPLGIEGLHQIGNRVSNLRHYFSLGVRYATLTHNCHNIYADAAITEIPSGGIKKADPHWSGVSPAGEKLIEEMNRLGMIVDLSHVSVDTMRDVLGGTATWSGSSAPVIFSHSSAYSLCPHPRNVPDSILTLVKKTNSVVMVNFSPDFISCVANSKNENGMPDFDPKHNTLTHVVEHIKYIGDLIGYQHVGLGSDFDGIPNTPEGLDDVSKFPELVKEMLKQGVSDKDAGKVVGGNVLRVWKDVEAIAAKTQNEGAMPLQDDLPSLRLEGAFGNGMGEGENDES